MAKSATPALVSQVLSELRVVSAITQALIATTNQELRKAALKALIEAVKADQAVNVNQNWRENRAAIEFMGEAGLE